MLFVTLAWKSILVHHNRDHVSSPSLPVAPHCLLTYMSAIQSGYMLYWMCAWQKLMTTCKFAGEVAHCSMFHIPGKPTVQDGKYLLCTWQCACNSGVVTSSPESRVLLRGKQGIASVCCTASDSPTNRNSAANQSMSTKSPVCHLSGSWFVCSSSALMSWITSFGVQDLPEKGSLSCISNSHDCELSRLF